MADFPLHNPVSDSALAGVVSVDDDTVQTVAMTTASLAPVLALKDSAAQTQPFVPDEGVVYRYRMRARDAVCLVQPSYVIWYAGPLPDFTGAQCSPGLLPCGGNPLTDLQDFTVTAQWRIS